MIDKFNGKATCKGSYLLGTACGHCPKCIEESFLSNEGSPSAIIKKLQHQLEIQTKRVENLRKSLNQVSAFNKNYGPSSMVYWRWQELLSRDIAIASLEADQELEKQLEEV